MTGDPARRGLLVGRGEDDRPARRHPRRRGRHLGRLLAEHLQRPLVRAQRVRAGVEQRRGGGPRPLLLVPRRRRGPEPRRARDVVQGVPPDALAGLFHRAEVGELPDHDDGGWPWPWPARRSRETSAMPHSPANASGGPAAGRAGWPAPVRGPARRRCPAPRPKTTAAAPQDSAARLAFRRAGERLRTRQRDAQAGRCPPMSGRGSGHPAMAQAPSFGPRGTKVERVLPDAGTGPPAAGRGTR